MNPDPQPATKPTLYRSDGPLGSLLNHIPLQSRFALTVSVVIGVIASVIAGGIDETGGQIALGVGIISGFLTALALAIRERRGCRYSPKGQR